MKLKVPPFPHFFPIDRTVALSDGVFAVVITLLVLGIEVPEEGALAGPDVVAVRAKLIHQLVVYFASFWVIAMYWSQHGLLFSSLRRMDGMMLGSNFLFMLPVTLLPFVTQLTGARPGHWLPVLVFALINLAAALLLRHMWRHATARPSLRSGPETEVRAKRVGLGLRVFFVAIGVGLIVALFDTRAGILCFVLPPIAFFLNHAFEALRVEQASDDELDDAM